MPQLVVNSDKARIKPANLSPSDTPLVCFAVQKIDENNSRIIEVVILNDQVVECNSDIESIPLIKASTIANLIVSGRRLNAARSRKRA